MTTYTVTINGVDYSSRMLKSPISQNSLVTGTGQAVLYLRNDGGTLNNNTDLNVEKPVVVQLNSIQYFAGYIDKVSHLYGDNISLLFNHKSVTRLVVCDYSQDFRNRKYTASIPKATLLGAFLTGLVVGTNIAYTDPGGTPSLDTLGVGDLEVRDVPRIDVVRDVLSKANYDGYVYLDAGNPRLTVFAIGTVSSGIVVGDNDILYADFGEKDGLDIANNITVRGKNTETLPTDEDAYTEALLDSQAGEVNTNSGVYVTLYEKIFSPTSSQIVTTFFCNFDVKCDAMGSGQFKMTYQVEGSAETDVTSSEYTFSDVAWTEKSIQTQYDVSGDANWGGGKDVTIKIKMRVVSGSTVYLRLVDLGYIMDYMGWKKLQGGSLEIQTTSRVKNDWAIYHTVNTNLATLQLLLATGLNLKFNEHSYVNLEFTHYLACTSALSYLEIRCITGTGSSPADYYYKRIEVAEDNWFDISAPLGVNQGWSSTGSPDWEDIDQIWLWAPTKDSLAHDFTWYMDHFRLSGKRWSYTASNGASIAAYRQRDYDEVLNEATLAEATARATSLLAKLKDPLETLTLILRASLGNIGGVNKWVQGNTVTVTCSALKISSKVYRMIKIDPEPAPRQDVEGGNDFVVTISCVAQNTVLDADRFRSIVKPR